MLEAAIAHKWIPRSIAYDLRLEATKWIPRSIAYIYIYMTYVD